MEGSIRGDLVLVKEFFLNIARDKAISGAPAFHRCPPPLLFRRIRQRLWCRRGHPVAGRCGSGLQLATAGVGGEEAAMARVHDQYLNCVFYLYPSVDCAERGDAMGGTGFVVSVPTASEGENFYYAVTNRHVIETGSVAFRFNTTSGVVTCVDSDEQSWLLSPTDDLAVALIGFDSVKDYQLRSVPLDQFVSKDRIAKHDIGPGDETFTVGRFVSAEGRQRNSPSVRFGNIAHIAPDPVRHHVGLRVHEQESFLVEARSIPGFSGSPVFVQIPHFAWRPNSAEVTTVGVGPWLLGVDWAHLNDYMPARDKHGHQLPFEVMANSGMMAVVPAWRLEELLMDPELKRRRQEEEDRTKASSPPPAVSLDSAEGDEDRFNRTVEKMLSTPRKPNGDGGRVG
jgi:hypothetical protein